MLVGSLPGRLLVLPAVVSVPVLSEPKAVSVCSTFRCSVDLLVNHEDLIKLGLVHVCSFSDEAQPPASA